MNLEQATKWRNLLSRVCAVLLAFFVLCVLEGLASIMRTPANTYQLLPGESVDVTGPLRTEAIQLSDLTYRSSSEQITFTFLESGKGFWLGGAMYRGRIHVGSPIPSGDHTVSVRDPWLPADKVLVTYVVKVYEDAEALRWDSKSFIMRYLGHSPWILMVGLLLLILLDVGINFLIAHRIEQLLAQIGKAEIYHVVRGENGHEIMFGLGTEHGVHVDTPVTILDDTGTLVCYTRVERVSEKDGVAAVPLNHTVKTGFLVWVEGGLPRKTSPVG